MQVYSTNGEAGKELWAGQPLLKVGSKLNVDALVRLGQVDPKDVSVELYYGPVDAWGNICDGSAVKMDHKEAINGDGEHMFTGLMPCKSSGRQGLAVRILPRHQDLVSPYEPGLILWEDSNQ